MLFDCGRHGQRLKAMRIDDQPTAETPQQTIASLLSTRPFDLPRFA
jgi:hypothetical protein